MSSAKARVQCHFKKLVSMRGNALPLCSICCEMLGKYGGPITLPCGKPSASCEWRLPPHCFTVVSFGTDDRSYVTMLSCSDRDQQRSCSCAYPLAILMLHGRTP